MTSNNYEIAQPRRILPPKVSQDTPTFIEKLSVVVSWIIFIATFPISIFIVLRTIKQYKRAVILRNGRVRKYQAYGPGLVFYLPCIDEIRFCDLRTICYCVPAQEALTKDALTVTVDAVIFYKVTNPVEAILKIANADSATQLLASTILRNAISTRQMTEVLAERKAISIEVFEHMKESTGIWGVSVVRVEIKEISMPIQLQKAMAAEAESSRLANAKIIVADAEIEATKNLDKATTLLSNNQYSMQLRYLQSLHTISGDKTHTYVLPIAPGLYKKLRYLQSLHTISGDKTHTYVLPIAPGLYKKVFK